MQTYMLKGIIGFLLVMFMAITAIAQKNTIPQLKAQIAQHENDTTGVGLLLQLSRLSQAARPDSALIYAQQGLDLSRKHAFKRGEADCMNRLGVVLWKNGKYDRALSFLLGSLEIREDTNDRLGILKSLSDIGIVYSDEMDNIKALSYHFRAKAIAEQLHEKQRLGIILSNIGNCYIKLNKVDSALYYVMQSYGIQQTINDVSTLPNTLSILGDINYSLGHEALALDYYRVSINSALKNDDQSGLADTYNSIGKLYKHKGMADSSIYYATKALSAAKTAMYPEGIYNASNLLTNAYQGKDEHFELFYLKIALAAKDSMFNAEKVKQIQKLSFNEAARQEEIAEEKHHEEETRLINLQLIGIAIFIPFFFLMVLLLNKSRTHRKVIDFMSVLSLLLTFEFVNLFIHPFVLRISNHLPLLELAILVALASVLVPMHHKLTHWLREKLQHTPHPHPAKPQAEVAEKEVAEKKPKK